MSDNLYILKNMDLNDIERIHGYVKYRLGIGRLRAKDKKTDYVTFKITIPDTQHLLNILKFTEMEKGEHD